MMPENGRKVKVIRWDVKSNRECKPVNSKTQEGSVVWFVRTINPAAVFGSWEQVVEHGVYQAAGDVKMSLIQFVWLNKTSGSLWPC